MMVIMPRPPICIKINIMTCPKILHVDTVGTVTNPVTQTEVAAVNNASMYGIDSPLAELTGRESNILPTNIPNKKLSMMALVVDKLK